MAIVTGLTATYVSDSRINVTWTPDDIVNWDSVRIYRYPLGGGSAQMVAQGLPTSATSWSDTTTQANTSYRYGVLGWDNNDPPSATVLTDWVSTTPAAPSVVTAERDDSGDVVVAWQNNAPAATSFEVQDGTTTVGTKSASPFTDESPDVMTTHAYRVRAVADGPRYSPWSPYSPTITLYAAPSAPDNLTPNGTVVPLESATTLAWSHNPTDTTPQTVYELRHRPVGSGTWTTLTGTTAEFRDISGAYVAAEDVEWQVRTKGAHADYSEWSSLATFSLVATPTVLIAAPVDASEITTSTATVEWTYYHAGGNAQSGWQVEILEGSTIVAQSSGTDTVDEWTSGSLPNGTTLTARVRVRESSGLWSEWDSVSFDVNYAPPPASTGSAVWQDGFGHVLLTATATAGTPAAVSHDFARSTDGGNTWTTFAEGMALDANVLDWEAPAGGTYHYRITAVSALPSTAHTVVEVTVPATDVNCAIWISGGPGFANAAQIVWNPMTSVNGGRDRRLNVYSGRTHPVETSSRQVPRTLSVQATIFPDRHNEDASTVDDLHDVFDLPGPHLYRDHTGRVMYGTLSLLDASTDLEGVTSLSFSITRTARGTDAQLASLSEFYAPRIAEVAPGVYQVIGADVVEAAPGVYEEVE